MAIFLANAFSIQMLDIATSLSVSFDKMTLEEVQNIMKNDVVISAVGHADTANVLSNLLHSNVAMNRINVKLTDKDNLIVAQIMGGRLPEGATSLPDGFKIEFFNVFLNSI